MYLLMNDTQQHAAAEIRDALREELLGIVRGKPIGPFRHDGSGDMAYNRASVVDVRAPLEHPELWASFATWSTCMRAISGSNYSVVGFGSFLNDADCSALFDKHWRPFCVKHFARELAKDEARRRPGGDLFCSTRGVLVPLWF